MAQPLVSILIPFKNTESFIAECVDSIVNQTYEHWEAIFVDDNSTDSSFSIVDGFAKKDSRIRVCKKMETVLSKP